MGPRNPDWKLSSILELVLDIWSSNDGVELPNFRDRFKSEVPRHCGDEHLHLQDSKPPPDA